MIHYYSKGTNFRPKFTTKINSWIKTIAKSHGISRLTINYIFCDDEELLSINKSFLGHDYYTDIITFDTIDDMYIKKGAISGDIFISVDTVRSNAATYATSFESELLRVMIHGILHLIGFDDKSPDEETEMHHQEDLALNVFYGC